MDKISCWFLSVACIHDPLAIFLIGYIPTAWRSAQKRQPSRVFVICPKFPTGGFDLSAWIDRDGSPTVATQIAARCLRADRGAATFWTEKWQKMLPRHPNITHLPKTTYFKNLPNPIEIKTKQPHPEKNLQNPLSTSNRRILEAKSCSSYVQISIGWCIENVLLWPIVYSIQQPL